MQLGTRRDSIDAPAGRLALIAAGAMALGLTLMALGTHATIVVITHFGAQLGSHIAGTPLP